jgi:hypothetical protein
MVSLGQELLAESTLDEGCKIFRPEYKGVNVVRGGGYPGLFPVIWINNFKKTLINLIDEPIHVKCRDVGSPGGRNNELRRWFHKKNLFLFFFQIF